MPDSSCLEERLNKISSADLSHISMMTSAGVDVEAKGQRYVIEAIPALNSKGIRVSYFLAGGGDKTKLEEFAKSLGVLDQVCFLGRLKHEEILEKLQKIDFYIQPSLQEGLPRSVIEAMAYACPVLGAKTAGIPELIDEKCVFKRKSSYDIVSTLINNLNKEEMMDCAKNNFEKSKKYEEHVLNNRRKDFFDKIKKYL